MRTVVSSGRSHSWVLVNTGASPVWSFCNLWSTSTSVLVLEVLLFSHRPIKIEAAHISCSLPEAKIKIWIWTLNSGPIKMEKLYLCLTRKENCCPSNDTRTIIGLGVLYSTWNIGHSLQVQRGAAPLRLNNQSGHKNCLFRQIEFSLMPLIWKTLRFITWVNLMFYLYCNVFYCDVMYFGSG